MIGYMVIARKKNKTDIVAEYVFDSMKEAIKFHAAMVGKGYDVVLSRVEV